MICLFICYNKINKKEAGVVRMKRRDKDIYIRDIKEKYHHILVDDYIENNESVNGIKNTI